MAFFSNDDSSGSTTRPARHIACPQRLKYIHNINDGYIPYVDDPRASPNKTAEKNGLGLYNVGNAWQNELMSLAQKVQTSLKTLDETNRTRSSRNSHSNGTRLARRSSMTHSSDEHLISKRLFHLSGQHRAHTNKTETSEEKIQTDMVNAQDHGIWLLPILCHILHIDTIAEVQDWLLNAKPTEKRLAMELVSRILRDMQRSDNESQSDVAISDLNSLYWPYKYLRRQHPWSEASLDQNQYRCERATSPLRLVTPARTVYSSNERKVSSAFLDSKSESSLRLPSIAESSRQSHRVVTSSTGSTSRGKTPLL